MPTETDELLLRQLPHSVEAEQAVLGSMLIDPRCVPEVIDKLRADDFYIRQNKEILRDYLLHVQLLPHHDPVTVLENMKQNGYYDENQSRGYILQLMDTTPTAANVAEYIEVVRENTRTAKGRSLGQEIASSPTSEDMGRLFQQGLDLMSNRGRDDEADMAKAPWSSTTFWSTSQTISPGAFPCWMRAWTSPPVCWWCWADDPQTARPPWPSTWPIPRRRQKTWAISPWRMTGTLCFPVSRPRSLECLYGTFCGEAE